MKNLVWKQCHQQVKLFKVTVLLCNAYSQLNASNKKNFPLKKESASIMLQKDFVSQMKFSAYMMGTPALEQLSLKPKKSPS